MLIGTAVVGAATMVFSIIMLLTNGLVDNVSHLSMLHPPFLLGLITGGATIFWFSGASTQAVSTGAYRAVEFIKNNMKLDEGSTKANVADSKRVVAICTQYAQKGMFNIFMAVFFGTLACAFIEPFFFIGYLISLAIVGLYQAVFMANAGGAWDNAKKIVETNCAPRVRNCTQRRLLVTPLAIRSRYVVGRDEPDHQVLTLFGLLAVEMAVGFVAQGQQGLAWTLAAVFLALNLFFVYRSFYGMRIERVGCKNGFRAPTRRRGLTSGQRKRRPFFCSATKALCYSGRKRSRRNHRPWPTKFRPQT